MSARDVTSALASFSSHLRFSDLPADVRTIAKHCVLDWLGVTLAGSCEEVSRIVLAEAGEQGGTPQATIVGSGLRTSIGQAALVNGTTSHALDYDDVQYTWRVHASVSVLPAVLALAERDGHGGEEAITAFVAGVETACRVAQFVTEAHRTRGHHATGTLGTLGAAAGASRLLGLGVERSATALGIAATQAAGFTTMFGTMCKPLHAGKAAANGLYAAVLAGRGFSARGEGIEGFADVLSPAACEPRAVIEDLGEVFHLRDVLFKYHSTCYSTHAAIEAASRLRQMRPLDPGSIEGIQIRVPPGSLAICNIQEPRTGLEVKFSLRHSTAMALSGRNTADEASFRDTSCADVQLLAWRAKTCVVGDPALAPGTSEIVVSMTDGAVHREFSDVSRPNRDLADQHRRLKDKFSALATPVIGRHRASEVIRLVSDFERLDRMDDLMSLLHRDGGLSR